MTNASDTGQEAKDAPKSQSRRINVTLGPRQQQMLADLAEVHETDQSDVVRRALALYKSVTERVNEGNGRRLMVAEHDGRVVIELVVY